MPPGARSGRELALLSYTPGWGSAGLALIGGCALGLVYGARAALSRRASSGEDADTSRERRLADHLASSRERPARMPASHLRRAEMLRAEMEDAAEEMVLLAAALRDVRDAASADEAIFWRWVESRDALSPAAWSTVGAPRPQFFRFAEWAPLAQWSARERMVQHDATEGIVRLATVPVVSGERLLGVLTLSRESGLPVPDGLDDHEALHRHARQVALLLALGEIRRESARHMRQSQALLEAVHKIHVHRTADSLARAICETAVEVSSAQWAALVRWHPEERRGELQHATAGLGVSAPYEVGEHSMLASVCHEALPLVLEDASNMPAEAVVFAVGERLPSIGSMAIVPLSWAEGPIGALMIAAPDANAITHEEARNLSLLGAVAATSLEIAWEIEEVSRRASTDPLTGLANRRHFDETMQRMLRETDRFGGSVALVLADIDHFKQVNDGYGHDAGDAVLRSVARTLSEGVRTVDMCARFGGEEIALLLPQTTPEGAHELADRLRRAIAGRVIRHGSEEIRVTASFGVAAYPSSARTRDGLFPAADKALYEAKHNGRNCVRSATLIPTASRA